MLMTFYRGDERLPSDIKRDGFDLWPAAKATLAKYQGVEKYLHDFLLKDAKNSEDIRRKLVTAKDRNRPTISLASNVSCGGYDGNFIYKIEVNLSRANLFNPTIKLKGAPLFRLYDPATRAFAIDLYNPTGEIVFLTKIQPEWIKEWTTRGEKFQPMEEVQASSSAAPKRLDPSRFKKQ